MRVLDADFKYEYSYLLDFVAHAQHDHLRRVIMTITAKAYDVPNPINGDIIGGVIILIILNFVIKA